MRIGMIGCGRISEKHIDSIYKIPEAAITALSDLSNERMEQAAEQIKTNQGKPPSFYSDYQDLLHTDVDMVVIAALTGVHAEMATAALEAGKHVVVEKPLALSLEESRELIALAHKKGKKLFVCHQLRFRRVLSELKSLISSGVLGEIYLGVVSMSIQRPPAYYEAAPWRGTWKQDGGMLVNQGIHMVDLLLWYMGEVQDVTGQLQWVHSHKETEDVALGMLRFKSGGTGLIEANSVTYPQNHGYGIKLFAEKGTVILDGKNFDEVTKFDVMGDPLKIQEVKTWLADRNEQTKMYEEIIQCIKGHQHHAVTAEEAERALEVIFALYESHRTKQVVSIPLTSFATTDMKGVR